MMGVQDGIDDLVEVVYHIVERKQRRDVHFTLVGDGPVQKN